LQLSIRAREELQNLIGIEEQIGFKGEMKLNIHVAALQDHKISGYEIELTPTPVIVDFGWVVVEIAHHLCIQPVRIGSIKYIPWPPYLVVQYSGDGLPFDQPGTITQWNKADLTFHWNSWQTVFDPNLVAFSSTEAATLLATVDDP
jgi:hypothetical protein